MDFEMISPGELRKYVECRDALIIDVRPVEEYLEKHIRNAVNIPWDRLENCCVFPEDMTLILYCERGSLSLSMAQKLAEKGYRVKTLVGGIAACRSKIVEDILTGKGFSH